MVKICVLASSSAGNCIYVSTPQARILIDAGISRKQTLERLAAVGEDPDRLDAIFITHEHSDHISGLAPLVKGYAARGRQLPIFLTHLTAREIDWNGFNPDLRPFQAGACIDFAGLQIQSFTIPHDSADPVGYTVSSGSAKIAIVTDLGYMPDSIKWHLHGCQAILLESNHDPSMLQVGPVPWSVKQRILSRKGHLSNAAACEYIATDLPAEVETLILGHLSENHNVPFLAEHDAREALARRGLSPHLAVAEPRKLGPLFHL
ncbi:MAG: MBL fold metallo-hydrolase [Solibacteraceae bacterium]|nr:MBL fold metallo-hydrolase [Solibacteraceae bacterium]